MLLFFIMDLLYGEQQEDEVAIVDIHVLYHCSVDHIQCPIQADRQYNVAHPSERDSHDVIYGKYSYP